MRTPDIGKRAGVTGAVLGALCVLGELCFLYPDLLVSKDMRPLYLAHMSLMRGVVLGTILTTFVLGATSVLLIRSKTYGLAAIALGTLAILMGGSKAEAITRQPRAMSAGLDYFCLDLLVLALVFIPLK